MNYAKLLRDNFIKKQTSDVGQIRNQLNRAIKDPATAEKVLSIDMTWSLAIAYHAMIRTGRALMFSQRHDFIYDSQNHTTLPEAKSAIKTAKELIDKIVDQGTEEKQGFWHNII